MKDTNINSELLFIKKSLLAIEKNNLAIGGWLSKNTVLRYFDYGESQLRTLEKTSSIVVSKIGRRKFYSVDSIISLLDKNIYEKVINSTTDK